MNIQEAIDSYGPVIAAEPATGTLICWDYNDGTLTVMTDQGMNGDYEPSAAYDIDGENTPDNAEAEAADVLADLSDDPDGDE